MNEENWKAIKQFYKETFNIEDDLVELVAVSDILLLCVSGSSNDSISELLDVDLKSVESVVQSVYDFPGWQLDLTINPWKIYRNTAKKYLFSEMSTGSILEYSPVDVEIMIRNCEIWSEISDRMRAEWV